jgi:hypothetical protein
MSADYGQHIIHCLLSSPDIEPHWLIVRDLRPVYGGSGKRVVIKRV